jgi:hypothetical protein
MSARKRVIIKLTDEQQEQIKLVLGKEVTHVIFQLIGGSHIIVDVPDIPDATDDRF